MDAIITSAISVLGVIISVMVSVIITRQQNKVELEKITRQLEQAYAKSLFDKRVETYPQLYYLLSNYSKTIQYNKQNVKNLIELRDEIDDWNSHYGLFFTSSTGKLSGTFRGYLKTILAEGAKSIIKDEDWNNIRRMLYHFEKSIRAEIGVATIEPVSNIEGIEEVYQFIDERVQEKEKFS
jgi:hypothetical protein